MLTKGDLKEIKKLLDPIKETQDSHTVSLVNLEREIKAYMGALDVERKRVDRHDERFEVIEESLDLNS
jgi:hypothetical protein